MARSLVPVLILGAVVSAIVPTRAANEPDELMPGTIAVVKTGALAKVVARAAMSFDLPDPDSAPTAGGATLRIFDTATGAGDNTYGLPAPRWTAPAKTPRRARLGA